MTYQLIKDLIAHKITFGSGFEKELCRVIELNQKSKGEILELKSREFVKQYRNVFENSKYYNELYQQYGLGRNSVKDLSDVSKVPVITKAEVREHGKDILVKRRLTVFKAYTSGTTGTPLQIYRDFSSVNKENAYGHFFQQMHGYNLGDPVVSLRGCIGRNRSSYYDRINNILHLSIFHLNADRIKEYYKQIIDFQPKVIKAYPSSIHIFAMELYKQEKKLNIPIAFTSSEVLHDFQREIAETVMNTKIYDWYGNAERTVAFGQFEDKLYREFPLYSHTEVKDDHLITTGFINSAFPLIRYKVDDAVQLSPSSNGISEVQKIEGRDDNYVVLKNGQQIGGLDMAFKKATHILATQVIQKEIGAIQVNLIPDTNFSKSNLKQIEKNLRNLVGQECEICFEQIETKQIVRSGNGKFKFVVSQL
jgi:phenylacetate-CoA ligase